MNRSRNLSLGLLLSTFRRRGFGGGWIDFSYGEPSTAAANR
jgi:hypothetical protein